MSLLLGVGVAAAGFASEDWRERERDDDPVTGYVLYTRRGEEDLAQTYRVETHVDAEPEEAVLGILDLMTSPAWVPKGQTRRLLRDDDVGRVLYTYIDLPMFVSDRDIALIVTREHDPATGVHRLSWTTANELAPPPARGVVRIEAAEGYWEFVPDGPGRCRATYVTYSTFGGSIPLWLARPMMEDQVHGDVQRLRDVLELRAGAVAAPPPRQ